MNTVAFIRTSLLITAAIMSWTSVGSALDKSLVPEEMISGRDMELAVKYSAEEQKENYFIVKIDLPEKSIIIKADYSPGNESAEINAYERKSGGVPVLDEDETEILTLMLEKFSANKKSPDRLTSILLRSLNLLASWPPGKPLTHTTTPEPDALTSPLAAGIIDICGKVNQMHTGSYPVWGSWKPFLPRLVGPFPWNFGDCMGRCGKGCIGDGIPNNGINIYSQDCFNHDACVTDLGYYDLDCILAFDETFQDFLYGRSCQKENLDLIINGLDEPSVMNSGDLLDITVSVRNVPPSAITGSYYLVAATSSGYYSLTATGGWQLSPTLIPYAADKLINIESYPIYSGPLPAGFPTGLSTFYFGFTPQSGPLAGQFEDALEITVN